jgi:hypothetical protein
MSSEIYIYQCFCVGCENTNTTNLFIFAFLHFLMMFAGDHKKITSEESSPFKNGPMFCFKVSSHALLLYTPRCSTDASFKRLRINILLRPSTSKVKRTLLFWMLPIGSILTNRCSETSCKYRVLLQNGTPSRVEIDAFAVYYYLVFSSW